MSKSDAALQYERVLLRLNDLQARGADESPEGESLRDELERLFWRLSQEEAERLGGLSADLYMLQDDEIYEAGVSRAEYERLLIRLHDFIAEGDGETEEADFVRDAMELPERRLTRPELSLLNGLSADLYLLRNDEISEARDEGETDATLESELRAAWGNREWDAVLRLLRKGLPSLPQERLATLRAYAYERLGLHESAKRFQQKAAELQMQGLAFRV